MEKANVALLQKTIDRQRQEIADLKARLAALESQVRAQGLEPVAPPTSQPAPRTRVATTKRSSPKRIVFIRTNGFVDVVKEINRAVNELDGSQLFNIVSLAIKKPEFLFPQFVPASDLYKRKVSTELQPSFIVTGDVLDAIEAAGKGPPDLIWLVGGPLNPLYEEESFIKDLKKRLKSPATRINTTLAFSDYYPANQLHLLWRIAHETGGVCVGKDGEPVGEPALPPPPAPEPNRKSILKTK